MNEENNNFSIDIQAEVDSMGNTQEELTGEPSTIVNVLKDIPLPETSFYTATDVDTGTRVAPQIAIIDKDFNIKMDAETAYSKAEETEKKLNEVRSSMLDMYNNMMNSWLPNNNKDEFEERPTTEPQNLIFENRRDRMSMPPKWA
jgi:hypothetical protein